MSDLIEIGEQVRIRSARKKATECQMLELIEKQVMVDLAVWFCLLAITTGTIAWIYKQLFDAK